LEEVQKTIFQRTTSNETGLIGYWNFDEPNGKKVLDSSPNHFHGVINGNATRVRSEAPVR
jgi:hypothetical protein